jgi:hypothetical protein
MTRTIYGLYYIDPGTGTKRYFYVGRSFDVGRRLRQHHYAKRARHEDVYGFIRDLEAAGIDWHHDVLKVIPVGEYALDNERWFVIKLTREGHQLQNMRYGSVERRQELARMISAPSIRSAADVARYRTRRRFAASKRLRRRILRRTLKTEGILALARRSPVAADDPPSAAAPRRHIH